ncbi:MAG: hypothetical protein KA140_03400 [Caldisericia bacterium]|nr:hypothetical protein [Caldisericia bacterium]
MRVRLLGLGIVVVLLWSNVGFSANGQTAVQMPFSFGSVKSYGYDRLEVTDKYVMLGNSFETKFLDVATGKEIGENDIDWLSVEKWLFKVGKGWGSYNWIQTNNKNYALSSIGGRQYLGRENIQPVYMSDGWFLKVDENHNRSVNTVKIIDSVTGSVILKFTTARFMGSIFRAMIIDRFLVISTPENALFFDKAYLKLEHVFDEPIHHIRNIEGNYLFCNNKILNLKTFEVMADFSEQNVGLKMVNGVLYEWYNDKEHNVYRFWAVDLETGEHLVFYKELPIKKDGYGSADTIRGMAGGLAYFQTFKEPGFEIVDPKTGESVFFEPEFLSYSSYRNYVDNDRYIVSTHGNSIVCFDTLERKLAWRMDKPMGQRSIGNDYYIEKFDNATLRVFSLTNPLKSIKIPIDPEEKLWNVLPGDSGVIFYYLFDWLSNRPVFWNDGKLEIYSWNGSKRTVPVIEKTRENLIQLFLFQSDVFALMKEDKAFVLYKYDKSTWTKVFSQPNDSDNFSFSVDKDRLALRTSDTRAVIVDISKLKVTRVLEVKPKTYFWLKDGFLIENPGGEHQFITHILTGQMVRGGDLKVLDVEGETVHYTYEGAIGVVNGNLYTEAKIDGKATSAAGGLFADDNWLYDSNGRKIQSLYNDYFGKIKMIAGKLCYVNGQRCLVTVQLGTPALYKIVKTQKGFELSNTGTAKLQGRAWVAKDTGEDFVARLDEGVNLDLVSGKSLILPNNFQNEDCFVVVKSNGFLDSSCLSEGQNDFGKPLWNGRNIEQSNEIFSMTHWGGK